jgi:hypothetical protein
MKRRPLLQLGDGRDGKGSGVLVFNEGVIVFLFYTGRYSVAGSIVCGEVIVNRHTPSLDANPIFNGADVGIVFPASSTTNRRRSAAWGLSAATA